MEEKRLSKKSRNLSQLYAARSQTKNYTLRGGRLLQYSIPTGMLRALAELKCRAIEQSTASNRGRGVHVRVSTNQSSFRYQDSNG